ncbi:MAG: HupE/UreJ family protein, partial [Acidobacteria bacterium]|nr:HupE/UreJ family protein [Acidobacteriota bacterium]
MAARVSLPSDRSFESFEGALTHIQEPRLPDNSELVAEHALMDVWFESTSQSEQSKFSIRPRFERLGMQVVTILRFVLPDGTVRAFDLHGDPGVVQLDPRWHQAALTFVELGFFHILDGIDHLLFLLCLIIPFRQFRSLVIVVTAFTVAHSVTLIASAYDYAPAALWFPPLVETLIA